MLGFWALNEPAADPVVSLLPPLNTETADRRRGGLEQRLVILLVLVVLIVRILILWEVIRGWDVLDWRHLMATAGAGGIILRLPVEPRGDTADMEAVATSQSGMAGSRR